MAKHARIWIGFKLLHYAERKFDQGRNFIKCQVSVGEDCDIEKGRITLALETASKLCEPIHPVQSCCIRPDVGPVLAESTIVAPLTMILTNPAVLTLRIKPHKPPIESLV
jgi:hypothetical protein